MAHFDHTLISDLGVGQSGAINESWLVKTGRKLSRGGGRAITDLLVTGKCAPTWVECPLRSESSLACERKLEFESSGARSSEKDRLSGNNLSIVLAVAGWCDSGGWCYNWTQGNI